MNSPIVFGKNGQLAKCLKDLNPDFHFLGKEDLDIADLNQLEDFLKEKKPEVILNLAAYTNVDEAEEERELTEIINAKAVGLMAKHTKYFIHISTDYVFSGDSDKAYKETDSTDPVNFYGKSKLAGENMALNNNPKTIILRTSWLYSEYGKNFLNTMIRLASERAKIKVVNDQIGSPTYAGDLASVILKITENIKEFPKGIYHYTNKGSTSWHGFASEIMKQIQAETEVEAIPSKDYPTKANRPKFSLLSTKKIENTLEIEIPEWKESLKKCLKKRF